MNGKFWKWLNRIFATGIWLQPFVMAGLILFFRAVFGQRPSILSLFFLSWLPSVYVWSENQRQRAAGKTEFGIEDTFHDRPTQYESPLKMQAMYPKVNEGFLFDAPEGSPGVIVAIDELGRLCSRGKIPHLHNEILLTGRSRNITLILITQSFEALQNSYTKEDVQSMISNCSYLAVLDVRSQETAKTICSMAGKYKERETTWSGSGKHRSRSTCYRDHPILEPSDLSRLVQMDEVILITAEYSYCRVKKCSYFKEPVLNAKSMQA